jgi:hypothetical protein
MTDITFQDQDEARAWDMYACANIACGGWDLIFKSADMMLLERRKRMAPEKVEREWITHNPGDPMPCDGEAIVEVKVRNGTEFVGEDRDKAKTWLWTNRRLAIDVIAWRPA